MPMLFDCISFGLVIDYFLIVMLSSLICSLYRQIYLSRPITEPLYSCLGCNLEHLNHYLRGNFLIPIWHM